MLEISKKIKTLRYGEPGHVKRARACKASQGTQNKPGYVEQAKAHPALTNIPGGQENQGIKNFIMSYTKEL